MEDRAVVEARSDEAIEMGDRQRRLFGVQLELEVTFGGLDENMRVRGDVGRDREATGKRQSQRN